MGDVIRMIDLEYFKIKLGTNPNFLLTYYKQYDKIFIKIGEIYGSIFDRKRPRY